MVRNASKQKASERIQHSQERSALSVPNTHNVPTAKDQESALYTQALLLWAQEYKANGFRTSIQIREAAEEAAIEQARQKRQRAFQQERSQQLQLAPIRQGRTEDPDIHGLEDLSIHTPQRPQRTLPPLAYNVGNAAAPTLPPLRYYQAPIPLQVDPYNQSLSALVENVQPPSGIDTAYLHIHQHRNVVHDVQHATAIPPTSREMEEMVYGRSQRENTQSHVNDATQPSNIVVGARQREETRTINVGGVTITFSEEDIQIPPPITKLPIYDLEAMWDDPKRAL
ncbi:uncharacterized protein J4E88_011012, partial [Alternaria novae-zelandiae]|uniref:uncharacterized protein n=1 Tax=Alternaria novae-zelandiae TaxID=430562 RepID=UPI0020C2B9F2